MPGLNEVKWKKANCAGVPTDIFYSLEEKTNQLNPIQLGALRGVCKGCVILSDCKEYALEFEEFGFWGGLTALERKKIRLANIHGGKP